MKRFNDLKLRTKIIIIFLAVSFVFTAGVSYFVVRISTNNLIAEIRARYLAEADDHLRAVDLIMDKHYHQIVSFAANDVFTRGTSTAKEKTAFLKVRKKIYGYASLSYFDQNRIRLADTEGRHLGQRHAMVRYWADVLAGKVSAGSDIRIAEELNIPIIYFAAAVKNEKGKAVGVVVARVNNDEIGQVLGLTEEDGRHSTLIDGEGNIIFSNCDVIKKLVLKEKITGLASAKAALAGRDGTVLEFSPYHKNNFFTAYAHEKGWHDFEGNHWSLLLSIEKEKALAPLWLLRISLISVAMFAMILLIGVTPLIASYITKPIMDLGKVAYKIKAGDLTQRAEVAFHDEVGELTSTFNQMIVSLQGGKEVLESQVAARTKELTEKLAELERFQDATVDRELRLKELQAKIRELEKGKEG